MVKEIYVLTRKMPDEEQFGLISQMRRAAVSIPANIAEGKTRGSDKEFCRFLHIAFASGAELETHLEIAKMLHYINSEQYVAALQALQEIMKMMNTFLLKLKAKR